VTIGIAQSIGSDRVYRSPDLNDYYLDPSRKCEDTVWYHHRFRLFPEPIANFDLISGGECLPSIDTLRYKGGDADRLSFIKYSWDNASVLITDTIRDDTLPDLIHTYREQGLHEIYALIQDTNGCYSTYFLNQQLGYFNVINAPVNLCLNKEFTPRDSVLYFDDPRMYWRLPGRSETMSWDFGDGGGFNTIGPLPTHSYASRGRYEIKLATVDARGCEDTATHLIDVGSINAAIKTAGQDYLCDQIVQFFDSSYFDIASSTDFITDYYWDFGDFTTPSILQNPFHNYSTNGDFILTLAVKTDGGCFDTAQIPVYLKGPEPYFDILSDTMGCAPFAATFKSTSKNTTTYIWRMGDQAQTSISASKDSTFSYTYDTPGEYFIYLEGSDVFVNTATGNTHQCAALFPDTNRRDFPYRKIIVLPVPSVSFNIPEPICTGDTVLITDESDAVYQDYNWAINDVDTTTQEDLKYVFPEEGLYSIKYRPTYLPDSSYQRHCYDSFDNEVQVFSVQAAFGVAEEGLCSEYIFTDSSVNASTYAWDFGHSKSGTRNSSTDANTSHIYGQDTGTYTACLSVQSVEGCMDTLCTDLLVEYIKELKLYNVFTPNADGTNDVFLLDIVNQRKYVLKIFNRWGELMFESIDPSVGWDGRDFKTGKEVPESTYFWVLDHGYNCEKKDRLAEGQVELIRQ
jgi:gliding motility-associated-like protein